ncbi:hypothetical protein ADUPG1_004228, partial [Aduncisulcus paluster]
MDSSATSISFIGTTIAVVNLISDSDITLNATGDITANTITANTTLSVTGSGDCSLAGAITGETMTFAITGELKDNSTAATIESGSNTSISASSFSLAQSSITATD